MELLALAAQYADKAGTCLLYAEDDQTYLGLFPTDTIRLKGPSCWRDCRGLLGPMDTDCMYPEWMGMLSYNPERPAQIPDILLYKHSLLIGQQSGEAELQVLRGELPGLVGPGSFTVESKRFLGFLNFPGGPIQASASSRELYETLDELEGREWPSQYYAMGFFAANGKCRFQVLEHLPEVVNVPSRWDS